MVCGGRNFTSFNCQQDREFCFFLRGRILRLNVTHIKIAQQIVSIHTCHRYICLGDCSNIRGFLSASVVGL